MVLPGRRRGHLAAATAARPAERERLAAFNKHRVWFTVREADGPRLVEAVRTVDPQIGWRQYRLRTPGWVSFSAPRQGLRVMVRVRVLPAQEAVTVTEMGEVSGPVVVPVKFTYS